MESAVRESLCGKIVSRGRVLASESVCLLGRVSDCWLLWSTDVHTVVLLRPSLAGTWFVPLPRADALARWPMGVVLPSYIYQLRIMLLARFPSPLIVFSLPRPSAAVAAICAEQNSNRNRCSARARPTLRASNARDGKLPKVNTYAKGQTRPLFTT